MIICQFVKGINFADIASNYKPNFKSTIKLIDARLIEGFIVDDFKTVIYKKTKE